jgi:hypothetical protein
MRKWLLAGACVLCLGGGGYAAALRHEKPQPKTHTEPYIGMGICMNTVPGGPSGTIYAC